MKGGSKTSTGWIWILCLLTAAGLCLAADSVTKDLPAGVGNESGAAVAPPAGEPEAGEIGEEPAETEEDRAKQEAEEEAAAVARPVSADPVQVYGWKEWITLSDGKNPLKLSAKLDTGAYTSSVHAEEKELFERDGRKWVRFVVTDPRNENAGRIRIEAPLVRIARIKELGGGSEEREVVRLPFRIGDRTLKADFNLSSRPNMLNPVLIGRTTIRELGWIDSNRAFIADEKVMR